MAVEWSGLSPELLPTLDRRAAEPLRSQQFVLGFGNPGERAIHAGITAIGDLLREPGPSPHPPR